MDRAHLTTLIEASRRARFDLSINDWRDAFYLARHVHADPVTEVDAGQTSDLDADPSQPQVGLSGQPSDPPTGVDAANRPADQHVGIDNDAHGSSPVDNAAVRNPTTVPLIVPDRPARSAAEHTGVPIRMPVPPPLAWSAVARAFRPLKRRVASSSAQRLDVPATVRLAAESNIWRPVLVPATERWLSIAVLVDDAASGPAWTNEVHALLRALQVSAAFKDIRVWHFDTDTRAGRPLTVRGSTTSATEGRNSREVVDPTGRQAVLILSDCVGAAWGDGRVGDMVGPWAMVGPVAIVQLLPQRLWSRCRASLTSVEWRGRRPFVPGQHSECRPLDGDLPAALGEPPQTFPGSPAGPTDVAGAMVPVLDLAPDALACWANMVAGTMPDWSPGVAFDAKSRVPPEEHPFDVDAASEDPVRIRVERFRATTTPDTFRLATLLSGAPLLPPVVRMIQRTMLRSSQSTHWAELLLSGLVHQSARGSDVEEWGYTFADGVREELLNALSRRESLDLLRRVSGFVNRHLGGALDFPALLSPELAGDLTDGPDRPLAQVAVAVLRGLGGAYRDKADQLVEMLSSSIPGNGQNRLKHGNIRHNQPSIGGDLVTTSSATETFHTGQSREISREAIWDVPQRTQHFTGRQELLNGLRQELVDNPNRAAILVPRAIFGLGGVGKTALANEYAHIYRNEYEAVWWIPAEDPADVRRSLVELSRRLRLPENTDQSETIRSLLRALHDGYPKSRWLLIYDNATKPELIRDLLPAPKRSGHVLITSRDKTWNERGALLEVGAFSRTESTALLHARAKYLPDGDADQLAELLEDLPLALHQAAAWHAETKLPAGEYRRRYDEKLTLLAEVELPPEYPRPVGAAFGVSYDQLQARSTAAAELLQLCSYFGPEPIFVEMLYRGRSIPGLPDALRRQLADRATIDRELRAIGRYELIRFDQARGLFQLHRLVQSVLRITLPESQRQTTPLHAHSILSLANPGNPDSLDRTGLDRHAQLSPHIRPSGIVESTDEEARKVVLDQIRYRYVIGDYEGSRDLAKSTVERWLGQHGERDRLLLLAQRHLATTLRALGEPLRSLELDQHVMELFKQTVGSDTDHYLVTANGYGADLRALGRFQEALEFDKQLLEQHREVLGDDDPSTLLTANNYAVDLRLMGEFGQARDLDAESVRVWTEGYGGDHQSTLFALSNLVRDLYGLGKYGEALDMQQNAIIMQEAALGGSHLSVLGARRSIAMLLRKLGRYQVSRQRAEENLAAYAARFPEHHEQRLVAAMSLANALRDENKDLPSLHRALELLVDVRRIYERDFAGHPFVEVCMINLAVLRRKLGDVNQARALNTDARARLIGKLSEQHPYTLCATINLSNDCAATGDYQTALELSASVLELSQRFEIRGVDHPYTLGCALNHALNLQGIGRQTEADELLRDTIERFDRVLGSDHPDAMAARDRSRVDADIEPPPT